MSGELLIQVIDIGRFRAIRPALDELDAARSLGLETLLVLREAAALRMVRGDRHRAWPRCSAASSIARNWSCAYFSRRPRWTECLRARPLFRELGGVQLDHDPRGELLDIELAIFGKLDWFRAIFLDPNGEA